MAFIPFAGIKVFFYLFSPSNMHEILGGGQAMVVANAIGYISDIRKKYLMKGNIQNVK